MIRITRILSYFGLCVLWVLISGSVTFGNIVLGLIISFLVLYPLRGMFTFTDTPSEIARKIPKKIIYMGVLFIEVIKANFYIGYKILQPKLDIRPGIIAYPFETHRSLSTVVLANTITLTPGTLIVDVHVKSRQLKGPGIYYIHVIDVTSPKEVREMIKQSLEKCVEEAFG